MYYCAALIVQGLVTQHYNCRNNKACARCAQNHETKGCKAQEIKCINCKIRNEKLGLSLNIGHDARNRECPVYKCMLGKVLKKQENI